MLGWIGPDGKAAELNACSGDVRQPDVPSLCMPALRADRRSRTSAESAHDRLPRPGAGSPPGATRSSWLTAPDVAGLQIDVSA